MTATNVVSTPSSSIATTLVMSTMNDCTSRAVTSP